MRWALVVYGLLVAAAVACGGRSDEEIEQALAGARQAMRRGAIDEALSSVQRVRANLDADPESFHAHESRLLHAEILIGKPDLEHAGDLLGPQVPDQEAFGPLRARDRYLRARLQVARGHLADALSTADSVRLLGGNADGVRLDAQILTGQILLRLGRAAEGETRLKAAVEQAAALNDRYREVLALNNLGMGFVVRSRFGEAVPWFERVLTFEDLADTSVYATAMNNAGLCYARLGDFDRAVATQKRAVALHERRGAAAPLEQALGELGSTYLLMEDVALGVPYLTRALAVAEQADLRGDAALWARNLAAAHVHVENWDEAERFNEQARQLLGAEGGQTLFTTLHAADIAAGRRDDDEAIRLFRQILSAPGAEAALRWAAHDGLATIARDSGDAGEAAVQYDAALRTLEGTRAGMVRTDDRLSFAARMVRFYRTYVDFLVERGDLERALLVAESSRGRVLAERHGVSAPAAATPSALRQLAAGSRTVLVSYWLGPARSYAWTIDGKGIRLHTLPAAAELEPLVRRHQEAIHEALGDPLARDGAGETLRRLLVDPVLESAGRRAAAVIVPDGALHGLNFETLPAPGTPRRYWIHDVELQIAPSLALLGRPRESPPARSLLVVGNPTPRNPDFPALRYASAEMSSIVRHFGGQSSRTYEGAQASPGEFRRARPEQFSLVHFTAHATANRESPLDSAVILSGPDDGYKLYARDVADLPLQAELVTVSACRSAGERVYAGEGLVGFAWAFLRAGARRVVAGLWDVDDRSTADLMDAMYARLAAGDSPPQALRAAKLALMARGGVVAKPYYWGPFQVFTVAID
jgi:CHAT domain-containing protein/tetratricopeptide (TPR) repeat protein